MRPCNYADTVITYIHNYLSGQTMEEECGKPIGQMINGEMHRFDDKCDRCEMLIQFISDMERDKELRNMPKGFGPKFVEPFIDMLMEKMYGYIPKSNKKGEAKQIIINL